MSVYRGMLTVLCIVFLLTAGCASLSVGDVTREQNSLAIHVTNSGKTVDAGVQVRVYQIEGMTQKELTNTGMPVKLVPGENIVTIPIGLEPGSYKLYVYVTINGERQTASIKDLVV